MDLPAPASTVFTVRITEDDVDDLTATRPGGHVRTAERLLAWAEQVDASSPVNRPTLLVAAADEYGFAGDDARRLQLCREAVEDGGHVPPDARCYLVSALFDNDLDDEAQPWVEALRSATGLHVHVYEFLGETLEHAGRYLEAIEVFTSGLQRTDPSASDALMLLHGRRRCREALGLPADDKDRLATSLHRRPQVEPAREVELQGYLPEDAFDPDDDETYEEQLRRVERDLQAARSGLPVALVSLAGLPAYAAERGLEPLSLETLKEYLVACDRAGHSTPWPPGRNDPCWCGRGAKYKRCCGKPAELRP